MLVTLLAFAHAQDSAEPEAPPPPPAAAAPGSDPIPEDDTGTESMPPPPKGLGKLQQMLDNPVMRPWGQLQVFTTLWDQDTDVQADPATYGDTEADPGFQLARARFGFFGELPQGRNTLFSVDYGLSMGINTPFDALEIGTSGVSMVDGFLRVSMDNKVGRGRVALGLVKVPFSRDLLMSSQDLVFQERAVGPANLTQVRDVGVLGEQSFVFGEGKNAPTIVLSGGAFNGNADPLGDFDPGLLYGGRLEFQRGDTYRTWDPEGGVAIGAAVSGLINRELATSTSAINGDLFLRLGPWSLVGEMGRAVIRPTNVTQGAPTVLEDTTRLAWAAQTSVFIGFRDEQGVEIAVRASSFDDNQRLSDNGDVLIFHGGAIWRSVLPQLDLGAGFIHREELGGVKLPNDTIRIWTQIRPRRR